MNKAQQLNNNKVADRREAGIYCMVIGDQRHQKMKGMEPKRGRGGRSNERSTGAEGMKEEQATASTLEGSIALQLELSRFYLL